MSLINDMLKDLDQRNFQPVDTSGAALYELAQSKLDLQSSSPERIRSGRSMRVAITVLLAGVALSGTAQLQHAPSPYESDLDSIIIPAPLSSAKRVSSAVGADLDTNQNKAHYAADLAHSAPQTSAPNPRTEEIKIAAAQPVMPANNIDVSSSDYIEVIHRPLTEKQQLLSDFHKAANTYNDGNLIEAERLLEDLLVRDNAQHQARMLLSKLYTQQKLDGRAEFVLANGLLHYPQNIDYASLYAQTLAAQGRDREAITALQNALPGASDNADFNALLAGLYQRTGNAAAAAESYLDAIILDPTHGEWWMGLGISSEQSGDLDNAKKAYSEALEYSLTTAVEEYATLRLKKLTAKNTANKNNKN